MSQCNFLRLKIGSLDNSGNNELLLKNPISNLFSSFSLKIAFSFGFFVILTFQSFRANETFLVFTDRKLDRCERKKLVLKFFILRKELFPKFFNFLLLSNCHVS